MKKMRDVYTNNTSCMNRIGEILQKIHNLDHTQINLKGGVESKPSFFSDKN